MSVALNFSASSEAKSNARYDDSESSNATRIFLIIFPPLSVGWLRCRGAGSFVLVRRRRRNQVPRQEPRVADDGRNHGAPDDGRNEVGILRLVDDAVAEAEERRDRSEERRVGKECR